MQMQAHAPCQWQVHTYSHTHTYTHKQTGRHTSMKHIKIREKERKVR